MRKVKPVNKPSVRLLLKFRNGRIGEIGHDREHLGIIEAITICGIEAMPLTGSFFGTWTPDPPQAQEVNMTARKTGPTRRIATMRWIVTAPWYDSFRGFAEMGHRRRDTIKEFVKNASAGHPGKTWVALHYEGWRCVKAEVSWLTNVPARKRKQPPKRKRTTP